MKKPLIISARQIGKTYIIDGFYKKEFKNYVYINLLEHIEIIEIFKEKINNKIHFTILPQIKRMW